MRFICDAMLGRLARWLRIFGYDAELASGEEADEELVKRAGMEGRVLLTLDKRLAANGAVLLPSRRASEQVAFLVKEFGISVSEEPVPRFCSVCNGRLRKARELPKFVEAAWECVDCGQKYWHGSHWRGIKRFVREVFS
ncbi:MAG: hypothetical protein JW834_01980 [Candidatus Diapherotrites archaeon]|nr:hypothetical protein [Candidatus Diapherotrites archaeon]